MNYIDLIVTVIAFVMLFVSGFGFGQILVWLFMPTPVILTVTEDGVSNTKRIWLFRVWPVHSRLLDIIDDLKNKWMAER